MTTQEIKQLSKCFSALCRRGQCLAKFFEIECPLINIVMPESHTHIICASCEPSYWEKFFNK